MSHNLFATKSNMHSCYWCSVTGSEVQPDFPFKTHKRPYSFKKQKAQCWKGMLGHSGGRGSWADLGGDQGSFLHVGWKDWGSWSGLRLKKKRGIYLQCCGLGFNSWPLAASNWTKTTSDKSLSTLSGGLVAKTEEIDSKSILKTTGMITNLIVSWSLLGNWIRSLPTTARSRVRLDEPGDLERFSNFLKANWAWTQGLSLLLVTTTPCLQETGR